ncbi:nuclear pore complex [Schistosoma japonicum]|uniref:Nuclear pore complex n=2 Tax=Schistosoma japonicum TaxID=6182 RepID=A0A4Z2DBE9_SCHJA|nr:nuclear pore complex [Schistosoma japonicum]
MACSLAIKKCLSVCGSHDEENVVSTLSSIKAQLQHGFKYYSQVGDLDSVPKEHVKRFVERISGSLSLSEPLSREILVHFLAVHDIPEKHIDEVLGGGCANRLLEDIRRYYWKERLSLYRLLKLCVCQWHDTWSLISDVLFAMTSYGSREELVIDALNEYLVEHQNVCSLMNSWSHSASGFISTRSTIGADESNQFGVIVAQKLRELIELLELILLGVHGLCLSGTLKSSHVLFKKVLETFWSVSFGSSLKQFKGNNVIVDRICFTQTLILIRAANLDSLLLFSNQSLDDSTSSSRKSKIHNVEFKSKSAADNGAGSKDETAIHFLYDSHLLNRLLASLSNLGEHQVHGPLLLFGAVCATVFSHPRSISRSSSNQSPDLTDEISGYSRSHNFDENVSLISDHCAQLSIQNLDVFRFLIGKLDRVDCRPPQVSQMDCNISLPCSEFSSSLISVSAHSAIFDLVTLLARDVTLWSLDGSRPPNSHLFDSLDYPNRDAFLVLFSRTLRVVVTNAHLVHCSTPKENPKDSDNSPNFSMDSGPRIGYRIFGLIESLMESFPYDLSVLRIYTSLLVPSNGTKFQSGSVNLVKHVEDLINHVPYLAEPLTELLSKQLSPRNTSFPQLTVNIERKLNTQVVLNKSRSVMTVNSKTSSTHTSLSEKHNIFSGVYLPSGTQGYIDQDLGLVVWRVDYSLWHVIGNEIYLAELALNEFHKFIASSLHNYDDRTVLNTSSCNSELLQTQAKLYAQFYIRLRRLLDVLEFVSACIKCDLYISQCLLSIEYIWMIILRYSNVIPSNQVNLIVQYITNNTSLSFIKTLQSVCGKNTFSSDLATNCSPIDELIIHSLLPNLLCLIGQSLLNLPALKSKQLIIENINLLINVLNSSHSIMPCMVINQNTRSSQLTFGLSACYLVNNILGYNSSEPIDSLILNHQFSPLHHYSTNEYHLLISYINFISGLFFFVRWVHSNSEFIVENIHIDIISLYIECSELIHGCLVFIIRYLMIMCSQVDYCMKKFNDNAVVNSGLIQTNSLLKVDFDQLANLAEHCFMLLTDVLTTRISEQDIRVLQMILNQLKQESSSTLPSLFHLFPKFIFEENHWPLTYQCITLHLLFNDTRSLNALIAFSSIHQSILLRQTETIENDFPMSICLNNCDASTKTTSMGSSSPAIRAVWLALTLVHHLLGLENKLLIEPSNSGSNTPLLTSIQTYYNSLTGDHYITTLFSYLRHSCSVGISRLVVALLKWITQYSSVDITNYLGNQSNQILNSCLKRLVSTTEDQLVRVGLYDLLSEAVLNSGKYGLVNSRFPVGLLRLLLTNGTILGSDRKLCSRITTEFKEITDYDCLDCTIDTLKEIQITFTQKSFTLNNCNQLSIVLYWSVTKFISSLYLLNIQPCIVNLKQRHDFWKALTDPLFTLLKLQESEKEPLSDIENELCGNVITILALELYSKTSSTTNDKSYKLFMSIMDNMAENNLYCLWFNLTRKCLNKMLSCIESDMSIELLQSRLTSLHNVTCRWKCLLLLNYSDDDDLTIVSDSDSSRKQSMDARNQSKNDFITIPLSILDHLIECIILLRNFPPIQSTFDLGNQLATTLTTTLAYLYKVYTTPKRSGSIKLSSTNELASYLTKLTDLLSSFRLTLDIEVQHMHSDILASTYILLNWYEAKRSNEKSPTDAQFELLHSSLFSHALYCLSFLTCNSNISKTEESAILQSINLIIFLWDRIQSPALFTHLTETGVLNNVFILLTECTKIKDRATLCHSLISLLTKLIISSCQQLCCNVAPAPLTNNSTIVKKSSFHPRTIDLDKSADHSVNESEDILSNKTNSNMITELILSYHDYISQSFCWPQLDILQQWLQDGETYSNMHGNSFDDNYYMKETQSIQYDWSSVLILEMQFLCLLHDNLGGMKHPLVCLLMQNFCMDNASQMEFLVNYWCLSLYNSNTSVTDQTLMSPLPTTSVLIQHGLLSIRRIQLAENILKLYWRILVAAECISTSGQPIIAPRILYSNNSRSLPSSIWSSYGPAVHSEFFNTILNLVQCQIHCCSILFQRHGFKSFKGVPVSGSHITPTKCGVACPSTTYSSPLPKTTTTLVMSNKPNNEVPSPHPVSLVSMELISGSETSGLELICLIRHLVMSLSVLMVQLPTLGKTSLMTSDELKYLKVHVHLTFNSPNLSDNSTVLTFGVLITLANSLGSLSSKLSSAWKSFQSSESVTARKERELCCLVQRAYEMVLSIIFSQATILLTSPSTRLIDKQLLMREVTAELKACHSFGISSRRTSSIGHSATNTLISRSPSSRSSSAHLRLSSASPQTPGYSSASLRNTASASIATTIPLTDSFSFGFDKAASRFVELSRFTL